MLFLHTSPLAESDIFLTFCYFKHHPTEWRFQRFKHERAKATITNSIMERTIYSKKSKLTPHKMMPLFSSICAWNTATGMKHLYTLVLREDCYTVLLFLNSRVHLQRAMQYTQLHKNTCFPPMWLSLNLVLMQMVVTKCTRVCVRTKLAIPYTQRDNFTVTWPDICSVSLPKPWSRKVMCVVAKPRRF